MSIIEKSEARRKGGYFMGLFEMGRHAAQQIGALDHMHNRISTAPHAGNFAIDRQGILEPTVGFADAPDSIAPWMVLRGDVERACFEALPPEIEVRYETRPLTILQNAQGVHVTLEKTGTHETTTEQFDLLVGADGIHSQVRKIVFGEESQYSHPLGTMICAFELPENPPGLEPGQGVIMTEVGKSFWVFPFQDHPATVLFTYAAEDPNAERKLDPKKRLREVYGDKPYGEFIEFALNQLDHAEEFLFDTTAQIKMDSWHKDRVVLVGDSAWCPSLYSGMGATTGLAGADLLGVALRKYPQDISQALNDWEKVLRPVVDAAQKQGANSGRKNFVSLTPQELDQRERNSKIRMKVASSPLLNRILPYTPFAKNRTADLTQRI